MASGAAKAPASCESRTSRDGSAASRTTPSASIARSPRSAPVMRTCLVRPHRVDHGLRRGALVLAERDRGRSDEQPVERRPNGVGRGDLHEPVLDDAIGHVLLAQAAPDLADLANGQTPVLRDDQRSTARDLLAQLGDGLPLGLGRHGALHRSGAQPARGGGRSGRCWPTLPCDGRPKARPGPQGVRPPVRADDPFLPRHARRRPRGGCPDPVRRIKPRPSRAVRSAGAGCLLAGSVDVLAPPSLAGCALCPIWHDLPGGLSRVRPKAKPSSEASARQRA